MKRRLVILIAVLGLATGFGCEDAYTEIEKEESEIVTSPSTEDDEDDQSAPSTGNPATNGG